MSIRNPEQEKSWSESQDIFAGERLKFQFRGAGAIFRVKELEFTFSQLEVITAFAQGEGKQALELSEDTLKHRLRELKKRNPRLYVLGYTLDDYIEEFRELELLEPPVLPRLKKLTESLSNVKL